MKNIGLSNLMISTPEDFTTISKIKFRRLINKPVRKIIQLSTLKKFEVEYEEELSKDEQYIFSASHYYTEDIQATVGSVDRNAWVLIGTTNQVEHNPKMYAAWLNGMIYVDRNNQQSRSDSLEKMEYILNNGSSVIIFPEGGWNNSENLLINPLFAGPYK